MLFHLHIYDPTHISNSDQMPQTMPYTQLFVPKYFDNKFLSLSTTLGVMASIKMTASLRLSKWRRTTEHTLLSYKLCSYRKHCRFIGHVHFGAMCPQEPHGLLSPRSSIDWFWRSSQPTTPECLCITKNDFFQICLAAHQKRILIKGSALACHVNDLKYSSIARATVGGFPTPNARFPNIHINVVGPLSVSQGCSYLHTMIGRFTSFPVAWPI